MQGDWIADWHANAREAIEFAADVRKDVIELYGFVPERERQAIGRLVRWADERVR